ncbi:MAG: alpha/beta fold hydrolase [Candidatus Promineifilaceae bacterium]
MATTQTESGLATIGGAQLYYELAGEGEPFVMLHAGVADSRQWNTEFAHFAQEYRVLRYDRRGFGRSEPAEGEFNHLEDLTALLDQLGLRRPAILMGCSMGGSLALDFALARPARAKALIMVGSGPSGMELDMLDMSEADAEHGAAEFAEAEKASAAGDLDRAAEIETHIWFDGLGRRPDQVNQEMRRLAYAMNRQALAHQAKGLGRHVPDSATPAAGRLGELEIPVLIVVGAEDEPYTPAAADYMLEHVKDARKVVFEDAAHLVNMDQPAAFRRAVSAFLAEVG